MGPTRRESGQAVRVLIVQEEPGFENPLLAILDASPDFEVIGPVGGGENAVDFAVRSRPDIIIIRFGRLTPAIVKTVERLMAAIPTPILLNGDRPTARKDRLAFEAMRAGALDFAVVDPGAAESATERKRLLGWIEFLARTPVARVTGRPRRASPRPRPPEPHDRRPIELVAIVASTGGPNALATVLAGLAPDLAASVVVVQHLADGFAPALVDWLAGLSALPVRLAVHGERLLPGTVYVAPDSFHLLVERGGKLALSKAPPVEGHRPAGNVLLSSVARVFGPAALGVILTGMGSDGAQGLEELHEAGGRTLAQDESSSQIFGMPAAAWETGAAEQLVPLKEMATLINRWARRQGVRA